MVKEIHAGTLSPSDLRFRAATGYDSWCCSEIFCGKVAELDDELVASTLRNTIAMLLR